MKKSTIAALVFNGLSSQHAFAQTEKGNWLVGVNVADLHYSKDRNYGIKQYGISLQPDAGYFVADRLAVGAGLELTLTGYKAENSFSGEINKGHTIVYGLSPFVRYYFLDASKHKVYGQAFGSYRESYSKFPYGSSSDNEWGVGISAGYNYFITPSVALAAGPYFNRYDSYDLGLFLGLQVFLPGRSE